MDPIPPPWLNTELMSVWTGWKTLRDREVVREAAAKGLHIKLAHTFIATRNKWDLPETEKWFEAQVRSWALELLNMQQVFKATHILSNIGLDPVKEFTEVLIETKDIELRDFLATHLMKIKKLDCHLQDHWMLACLRPNKNFTIKDFLNHKSEWKIKVATEIFFSEHESCIVNFLEPVEAWRYLLINNEITLLHDWIHISLDNNFNTDNLLHKKKFTNKFKSNSQFNVHELFSKWIITKEMLADIKLLATSEFTKDYVLNHLSTYGIFLEQNLLNILGSLSKMEKLPLIVNILESDKSNVKYQEFIEIFLKFCLKNELYHVIISYLDNYNFSNDLLSKIKSKIIELWIMLRTLVQNLNDGNVINKCILKTSEILCTNNNCSLDIFLHENLEIFLALILFDKSITLQTYFTNNKQDESIIIDIYDLSAIKRHTIFKKLPFIENIVQKQTTVFYKQDITLYQLLTNYMQIDFSQLFYFRYKNNEPLPCFSSERLVQRYGHREKLTFTYYLKLGRPSIASKLFIIENFKKYGKITTKMKYIAANLAHAIALQHFHDYEISCACVAFIELIGVNSDLIRVHIDIVNILLNVIEYDDIINLFNNIEQSKQIILSVLEEEIFKDNIKNQINSNNLSSVLMSWDVAIKFANLHSLNYPDKFLKYCLKENLWLEFLIFAQYHIYPHDQILKLSQKFSNQIYSEHISHAIAFELKDTEDILSEKIRNDFKKFEHRNLNQIYTIGEQQYTNSYDVTTDYYIENLEFIQILCRCHRNNEPIQTLINVAKQCENPNFITLATFYEPDNVVSCWLIWLCISTESVDLMPTLDNKEEITPTLTEQILKNCIKSNFIKALAESFTIFLPENPLCYLTSFLNQYAKKMYDETECLKSLKHFKTVLNSMKDNSDDSDSNNKMDAINNRIAFLTNRNWLSEIAVQLVSYTLAYGLQSRHSQLLFLTLLIDEKFHEDILSYCPDFLHYKLLLELILEIDITVRMPVIMKLDYSDHDKEEELLRIVNELVALKYFDIAFNLCKLEFLSTDFVMIEMWKNHFVENRTADIKQFWKNCEKSLQTAEVNVKLATQFFISCAANVNNNLEKYILLKLAFNWLKKANNDDNEIQNIELEMWWLYLIIDDWNDYEMEFVEEPCLKIVSSEIRRQSKISTLTVRRELTTDKQKNNFENLIGKLLDNGQIVLATRLEQMFGFKTKYLSLIETCMKLAEGELSPYNLNSEYRLLLEGIKPRNRRRTLRSNRISNSSTINNSLEISISPVKDTLELNTLNMSDSQAILEGLVHQVIKGLCIAGRVLCCYRISQATSRPYARILANYDASALLKMTLTGDFDNKLELANDIMVYHNWNKHQICEFLCAELVSTISKHIFKESSLVEPICLWGFPLDGTMHVVLELCPEPSILGASFLVHATAPLSSSTRNALCLATELLIRAHDCFTADCNIEGISKVLNRTRILVSHLTSLQAWAFMVRLLTGLGRYKEMDYVFQILLENEQFEWLLGQGTARAIGLRRATMDFLNRCCPGRRELSRLVALRWGLHDSAAELWENEAKELISNLVSVVKLEMQNLGKEQGPFDLLTLSTTDEPTKKVLENAMICLTHAVQHHLLADRHSAAQQTTRLAELVALQLGLIATSNTDRTVCILQLTQNQFSFLITNELGFCEAKILSTVYDFPVDWAQALFNHCIVKNNHQKYLTSFLNNFEMTDVIAKDVVRKYLADQKLVMQPIPLGLRAILDTVRTPTTKYRLASELGLKDVIQSMLESPVKPYLKDTVWKTGCPAPNT